MLHSIPISAFRSARDTSPSATTLGEWLLSTDHQKTIESIRATADKDQRNELKKALPAATISGTFTTRNAAGLVLYNGLVCLDFDAKENPGLEPDDMKQQLAAIPEVAYCATSVGGAGVYAIVPTDNTDPLRHADVVVLLGKVVKAVTGLVYDQACKDVCRLRFVSFDDNAWWNPHYQVFEAAAFLDYQAAQEAARPPRPVIIRQAAPKRDRGGEGRSTLERVESCIAQVEQKRLDLTTNYDTWVKLGMALATEFGTEGESFYDRLSQFHPKYNASETAAKYANLRATATRVRIGTFFQILKDNGIRP